MRDFTQGNYMVYELARTRRGNGRCSFYVILSQDGERELSRSRFGIHRSRHSVLYFRPLQFRVATKKLHLQTQYLFSYCYPNSDNSWELWPETLIINLNEKQTLLRILVGKQSILLYFKLYNLLYINIDYDICKYLYFF